MKYSLMSHMIDQEIKLKKPTFIHRLILRDMGYTGEDPTLEEAFAFLNAHGFPAKNGSLSFRDLVRFARENGFDGLDMMAHHFDEDPAEARAVLEEYGVTLSAVNVLVPFSDAGSDGEFAGMLQNAKETLIKATRAVGEQILCPPRRKNRRNTLCISRFLEHRRAQNLPPNVRGDLFSVSQRTPSTGAPPPAA